MNRGAAFGGCRVVGGWWLAGVCAAEQSAPRFRRQRCGNHQPPTTNHPSPTTVRRLLSRRVGEGAGRPGLARCCCRVTVSTKQTCPAQPFSTRLPGSGPEFGPDRIAPQTLLPTARGGHDFRRRSAQEARGEQAQAIHRPPQGPPKYPSPGLHRSTTARRHRGAGSDALPTDGMARSLTRGPARMVRDAVYSERRAESGGWRRGIC